jgi:hypothetical protein
LSFKMAARILSFKSMLSGFIRTSVNEKCIKYYQSPSRPIALLKVL